MVAHLPNKLSRPEEKIFLALWNNWIKIFLWQLKHLFCRSSFISFIKKHFQSLCVEKETWQLFVLKIYRFTELFNNKHTTKTTRQGSIVDRNGYFLSIAESFYPVQSKYTRQSPLNTLSPLLRLRLNLYRRYEVSAYEFEKFAVSVITATENSVWLAAAAWRKITASSQDWRSLVLGLKLPTELWGREKEGPYNLIAWIYLITDTVARF